MKTIQFRVKLLSDIIISQSSKTKGNKQTLDFIPGSNFLGIVAQQYESFGDDQITVFHSSKVRFGDAHPLVDEVRALRQPACFHTPKLKSDIPLTYVHHLIEDFENLKDLQLKQARNNFYTFIGDEAKEYKAELNFAIKSAYDRDKRRSKDEQMYGYQSMEEGSVYCLGLNVDDEVESGVIEKVKVTLIGKHTIGRSRTAQYGLVEITEENYKNSESNFTAVDEIIIYAESRLIFNDEYGNLTFMPKPEDFGITGGEIDWSKSQIRTFAYSPWNFKRSCFDAERKGIEKGSTIVIKGGKITTKSEFAGLYQNEGFGKVIVNPDFFEAESDGKSKLKFIETKAQKEVSVSNTIASGTTDDKLLKFIKSEKEKEKDDKLVYKRVNEFVNAYTLIFKDERFASQWGTIRSLAMQYPDKADLKRELFTKKTTRNGKEIDNAYLTHGVAKDKWDERGRRKAFEEFFDKTPEHMIQFAIINLAAEMAKKSEGK
jgi:hypothetical protein